MMQTNTSSVSQMAELKVNLHIIEACNRHCEFCFAKFHCRKALSLEDWKRIVDNIVGNSNEGAQNDETDTDSAEGHGNQPCRR